MNETAGPAILAEGLVKHYSGRDGTVEAVRGVDLEVAAGEIFGFLGPNGAGKSTTVRMLTTLLTITSGRAEVAGVDIGKDPDGAPLLLVGLTASWGVVYAGFMQLIALKTRSAAATNSGGLIFFPLLFLTPNFVPRDMLTRPMEVAATVNPVTYLMEAMRSLILVDDVEWGTVLPGFAVVAVLGAVMLAITVRMIKRYD